MPVSAIEAAAGGPRLSRLIAGMWRLGDWQLGPQERLHLIQSCLDLGLTTFDHADIYGDYGCEDLFGEALALRPGLRDRMQLISKCGIKLVSRQHPEHRIGHYDTSRAHVVASAERSLQRLRTDYLDVLLIHRPDPLMQADEVAAAFVALREAGKVRHFGVSNFTTDQVDLLASRLPFPLVTNQVECSVLNFEVMHDGTLDQCQRLGITPMAWSPLGGGRLFDERDHQAGRVRHALRELAAEIGAASWEQLAYTWLLHHPSNLLPILGTGRLDRIAAAADATALSMTRQQWFTVWRASKGHDVP